jgi:hypothetical protein
MRSERGGNHLHQRHTDQAALMGPSCSLRLRSAARERPRPSPSVLTPPAQRQTAAPAAHIDPGTGPCSSPRHAEPTESSPETPKCSLAVVPAYIEQQRTHAAPCWCRKADPQQEQVAHGSGWTMQNRLTDGHYPHAPPREEYRWKHRRSHSCGCCEVNWEVPAVTILVLPEAPATPIVGCLSAYT